MFAKSSSSISGSQMIGLRRHSRYLIVLAAGPIVPIALSFAGLLVARTLLPSEYGRIAYFFSSFNLITILGQLGLGPLATGEVARVVRARGAAAASLVTPPYVIARIASIAFLIPFGVGAALLGDQVLASATLAAGVALLATFAQALAQGLGRASFVASVQIGQALVYLMVVVVWAREAPERVFLTVTASYVLALLVMSWACRSVVPDITRWWSLSRGHWRGMGHAIGWLYTIALLMTPFSSLAVLVLGQAGRFDDAAAFSIAFTIPQLMSVSAATIIGIQYYPQLCQLLVDSRSDARRHFDLLYRLLAWMGISAAAILLIDPAAVISVLFTSAYAIAIAPLASLSLTAALLPLIQLGLWTLIAHRLWRSSVALAATQLVVVLPFIVVTLLTPGIPLWVVGVGHTTAAAAALSIAMIALLRLGDGYDWRPRRIAFAAVAGILATAVTRATIPAGDGPAMIVSLAVVCITAVIVTGLVVWSPEIRSTLARTRASWRLAGAAEHSDTRSAQASSE
jgi:O-antigen/teichoic acid export membrane protein